jgi:hypothetical protein
MLKTLLKEMDIVQPQGAGYYTCSPFSRRFNRLLALTKAEYPHSTVLGTFDPLDETDPKDPADKSKRLLEIRIEITQLIGLLESMADDVKP